MKYDLRRLSLVGLVGVLLLGACGKAPSDAHAVVEPATIEALEDQEVVRITLTEMAAQRLDIQTVPVEQSEEWLVVPSDAVFVDTTGTFWLYTSPEPLVFIRQQIGLDHEQGDQTYLSDGPDPGTAVVTVGVPELYGAETGIGH